jgi:hypothetical protein
MTFSLRFELTTWCMTACMLCYYATSIRSLVMMIVCTRYTDTEHDTLDSLYLPFGDGLWCWSRSAPRSGHDVTGQDINLDFPDA